VDSDYHFCNFFQFPAFVQRPAREILRPSAPSCPGWNDASVITARLVSTNQVGHREVPASYLRRFMEKMAWAVDREELSMRRLASLLEVTIEELAELFTAHGLLPPFEL
jgi:hypothetical protein